MAVKSNEEESKKRLKATVLEVVDTQLNSNDPPETKQTLDRLIAQGISPDDAKIYIAQAVSVEIFSALKHKKPYDQKRYIRNLQRLPKEPWA